MQHNEQTQDNSQIDNTSFKEAPFLILKGFLMGSADIVPGVSGGTMALIVGIYERLINAIKSVGSDFFKEFFTLRIRRAMASVHWKFLVMLLTGIFGAILFFTKVVPLQIYMFTHPELIFGLFFGLILGSIFILIKAIESFTWKHGLWILLGSLIGFWVVTLVPADTSESPFFIFVSGSIAICAMILPGISGSYLLLILRKYDFILTQIGKLGTVDTVDGLITLAPFVLGAVVGLALFSRILSWLLDHYYAPTLAVLIGFLIGSLYVIWPYQDRTYAEFVSKTEVVEYTSEKARSLRAREGEVNLPEYERLGAIINPDATFDELKKVEVETVKKKLIKSDPFVPFMSAQNPKTSNFWTGILGIFVGLIAVIGLDYIRET
ncbi:MAG: DUF368 domain-containing protein [Balneolaceae bacterium]|nr:DUF368 domain-containing protein [Balneolaceae bacterium]